MKKDVINPGESFFKDVLKILNKNNAKFLLTGTYAFREYTGINRKMKDIDLLL